jgi:hypothetical protein
MPKQVRHDVIEKENARHPELVSGSLRTSRRAGYLASEMLKQIRHDVVEKKTHVILNLFQDPSGQATMQVALKVRCRNKPGMTL